MEILRNNFYKMSRLRGFFIINKKETIKRHSRSVSVLLPISYFLFFIFSERDGKKEILPKREIEKARDNLMTKIHFYLFSLFCLLAFSILLKGSRILFDSDIINWLINKRLDFIKLFLYQIINLLW